MLILNNVLSFGKQIGKTSRFSKDSSKFPTKQMFIQSSSDSCHKRGLQFLWDFFLPYFFFIVERVEPFVRHGQYDPCLKSNLGRWRKYLEIFHCVWLVAEVTSFPCDCIVLAGEKAVINMKPLRNFNYIYFANFPEHHPSACLASRHESSSWQLDGGRGRGWWLP